MKVTATAPHGARLACAVERELVDGARRALRRRAASTWCRCSRSWSPAFNRIRQTRRRRLVLDRGRGARPPDARADPARRLGRDPLPPRRRALARGAARDPRARERVPRRWTSPARASSSARRASFDTEHARRLARPDAVSYRELALALRTSMQTTATSISAPTPRAARRGSAACCSPSPRRSCARHRRSPYHDARQADRRATQARARQARAAGAAKRASQEEVAAARETVAAPVAAVGRACSARSSPRRATRWRCSRSSPTPRPAR